MADSIPEKPHKEHKKNPRSIWSFYGHGFWKAFKKSLEKYGWAILICGLVYSAGIPFIPAHIREEKLWGFDMNYWLTYAIPGTLLLLFLAYHLFRAPYEIYLEQYQKHEAEIGEKQAIIKKLETEIECLRAPMLEIEAVTTNIKSARWHSCKIVIYNKNSTKTADDLRVELISLIDELAMPEQAAYFHPPFPVELNPEASGTNKVNPGDRMQYHLFRVSANQKPAIIKDGAIVGFTQNLTAHFNISDAMEHNTAMFKCQKPYRIKLAVSARDFPISEREFELIFVNESNDYQISVKQTLVKV